MLTKW